MIACGSRGPKNPSADHVFSRRELSFLQLRGPVQHYRDGFGRCCCRVDKEPLAIGSDVPTENL